MSVQNLTYVIYTMINKQNKSTSGEISQISEVALFFKCCTPEISETDNDRDTKL